MTTSTRPRAATLARTGTVVSALAGAFLLFDAVTHISRIQPVLDSFAELGFPVSAAIPIGLLELACLVLYAVPRTSVLGAILLTGYLGGAMCAQIRVEAPLLSTALFPVYVGAAVWLGLYLRNADLRALLTGRRA